MMKLSFVLLVKQWIITGMRTPTKHEPIISKQVRVIEKSHSSNNEEQDLVNQLPTEFGL